MKGVSEIIAVILIVMIVVSLAALAYTWFSTIFSSLTTTTSNATTTTSSAMTTSFKIEIARNITGATTCCNISVTLRSVGTAPLDLTKISAYINNMPSTIPGQSSLPTNLGYGSISTFNVSTTSSVLTPSSTLRIIAANGMDQTITIT